METGIGECVIDLFDEGMFPRSLRWMVELVLVRLEGMGSGTSWTSQDKLDKSGTSGQVDNK